jgi:hypothetical protein
MAFVCLIPVRLRDDDHIRRRPGNHRGRRAGFLFHRGPCGHLLSHLSTPHHAAQLAITARDALGAEKITSGPHGGGF